MKRILALTLAAACVPPTTADSKDPHRTAQISHDAESTGELLSFSGATACADLEGYLEDSAVLMMTAQLEASRDSVPCWGWWCGGGWGWGGAGGGWAGPGPGFADAGSVGGTGGGTGASPPPAAYTTTNTQVRGVDEADIVKNDGTRIFALAGGHLYTTLSWPASELSLRGKLKIEGWPLEMFLTEHDQVVVFSSVWQALPIDVGSKCDSVGCFGGGNSVKVTVVDVSTLSSPTVKSELWLPGSYTSARRVGNSVRLVMTDALHWPSAVRFWPETAKNFWTPPTKEEWDAQIKRNEEQIRATRLDQWLPPALLVQNGQRSILSASCQDFSRVSAPVRMGQLVVATIDLDDPSRLTRSHVLAEAGEVYASHDNLYVSTRHFFWWPQPGQKDQTYVHQFDLRDPQRARYLATGKVEGHIVDQFSMDEDAAGRFRIATTIDRRVIDDAQSSWWGRVETANRLAVLARDGSVLRVTSTSDEFEPGERIMSTRFIGDRAYVTTFRQTDPFLVFDMTACCPVKLGELKIPGFSSYMHPLDANHLLTIGTFVPETGDTWSGRRLQLQIMDVTNPSSPQRTHLQLVGTANSSSEAQWNHKAFNYFAEKGLLAIPFADYQWSHDANTYWSAFTSELRVFGVDVRTGFTAKGAISLTDQYRAASYYDWSYYWTPDVRRSVMADDFVYAVSDVGIRAANVNALGQPLATVTFDRATGF